MAILYPREHLATSGDIFGHEGLALINAISVLIKGTQGIGIVVHAYNSSI